MTKYTLADVVFQPHSTHWKFQDLTGQAFGRLTVLGYAGEYEWWAECSCELKGIVRTQAGALKNGNTRSCSCLQKERAKEVHTTHGQTVGKTTPEYKAYINAQTRATNPNCPEYKNYGDRGIEFRFNSFEEFFTELGARPRKDYSVDRIDVNGHYEVGNVHWATDPEQARNKRSNRMIEFQGRTQCLMDWAKELGITWATLQARLGRLGWSLEKALTTTNLQANRTRVKK
jgi:hypothetical protein